jgi:hypothetical protein
MYKHDVKEDGYFLADGVDVPAQEGTVAGAETGTAILSGEQLGGSMGGIGIVARVAADADLELTNTKVLTIALTKSDTTQDATSFASLITLATVTSDATDFSVAAKTELGEYILPNSPASYYKLSVACDDTAPSGGLDVYTRYNPR